MYSRHHFVISVTVGVILGFSLASSLQLAVAMSLYAGVLGVAIDLDHFVIARLHTGSWRTALSVIESPFSALTDQEEIFEDEEVLREDRILSHLLISPVLVLAVSVFDPTWAWVTGVVLYLHILTDATADTFDLYTRV